MVWTPCVWLSAHFVVEVFRVFLRLESMWDLKMCNSRVFAFCLTVLQFGELLL